MELILVALNPGIGGMALVWLVWLNVTPCVDEEKFFVSPNPKSWVSRYGFGVVRTDMIFVPPKSCDLGYGVEIAFNF